MVTEQQPNLVDLPGMARPPADVPEMQRGEWLPLPPDADMARYLVAYF